jgi:hypothetical protein
MNWDAISAVGEDIAWLPGIKAWWPTRSHWYSADFISFVQPFIDSTNSQRMYSEQG